jgi:hypothetical protein
VAECGWDVPRPDAIAASAHATGASCGFEHQLVAGDRYRARLPWPVFAAQPPFAAFPVGGLRRLSAEHYTGQISLDAWGVR